MRTQTEGVEVNTLLAIAKDDGGGRIYAGLPSNWGHSFTVGEVPVYIYLTDVDADSIGFTLRTTSLMTGPEAYFDESNLGDYATFGVRYLLLPAGTPASGARDARHARSARTSSARWGRRPR